MPYAVDFKVNLDTGGGAESIERLVKEIRKVSIACEGIINIMSKGKFGTPFIEATEKAKQLEKTLEKLGNEGIVTIVQGAKKAEQAVVEASIKTQKWDVRIFNCTTKKRLYKVIATCCKRYTNNK